MTTRVLSKLFLAVAALFGLIAIFWLILPWWQVLAGAYEGPFAIIVCTFVAFFFGAVGRVLYGCYRRTQSGQRGLLVQAFLWSIAILAGFAGFAMVARIARTTFLP